MVLASWPRPAWRPINPRSQPLPAPRAAAPADRSAVQSVHGLDHACRAPVFRSATAASRSASPRSRASRSASSDAWALARSDGKESGVDVMTTLNQLSQQFQSKTGPNVRRTPGFLRASPIAGAHRKRIHLSVSTPHMTRSNASTSTSRSTMTRRPSALKTFMRPLYYVGGSFGLAAAGCATGPGYSGATGAGTNPSNGPPTSIPS